MNYQFTNIAPQKDGQGNVINWIITYTGNDADTGDYQNGTVHVSSEQLSATGLQTSAINALIAPAVQELIGTTTQG